MGAADPIFVHQLALELGMTVQEIGQKMSAHELCVRWPAFFKWRQRTRDREEAHRQHRESLR